MRLLVSRLIVSLDLRRWSDASVGSSSKFINDQNSHRFGARVAPRVTLTGAPKIVSTSARLIRVTDFEASNTLGGLADIRETPVPNPTWGLGARVPPRVLSQGRQRSCQRSEKYNA